MPQIMQPRLIPFPKGSDIDSLRAHGARSGGQHTYLWMAANSPGSESYKLPPVPGQPNAGSRDGRQSARGTMGWGAGLARCCAAGGGMTRHPQTGTVAIPGVLRAFYLRQPSLNQPLRFSCEFPRLRS
jgi:hypothetical protein